jgi:benzoyl-CoA reductase subunit C
MLNEEFITMCRTFEEWRGKPLDQVLYECQELFEDTTFPTVRRWRESGGKVLGHFQVYFPEEIAHAAGMLPFKVRGAPIELVQADSRFGSYLCSILKTSLELALSKRIELAMFVTHPICDAARNLGAVWGRNFAYPCQILYLPQNANSPAAVAYLREEYARLQRDIEKIVGRAVRDEDLRRSMAVYNHNRALLRKLYAIKRDKPWLVSADEAYVLTAIGGMMPREEHNELLEAVLPQIEARLNKKQDKIRLVFEGGFCEQPPLDLIRTIGRSCYVVDDDLLIGLRWILEDVPLEGDPLLNLASAYIETSSYSPVQHDLRKPKEKMLIERIRNSGAEAAILAAAKMCEPGLEEQVAYLHALEKEGIPYFITEFEEKMTSFEQMEVQLETFVENILFN